LHLRSRPYCWRRGYLSVGGGARRCLACLRGREWAASLLVCALRVQGLVWLLSLLVTVDTVFVNSSKMQYYAAHPNVPQGRHPEYSYPAGPVANESPHELEPHDAPWSLAPLRFLRDVPGCLPFDFCRLTAKSSIQHDLPERPHRNPAQHTRHTGRPTEWHAPQRGSKDSVELSKEPDEYRCYGCNDICGASRSLAHYSNGTATCRLFERRASLVILHPKTLTRYPTRLRIRFHFPFPPCCLII